MMLSIHPFVRHGTTQRERLLKALVPENLQLDDRSMADLLAFAGKYAGQIRFWSSDNLPDGDWSCFFEKDATALFAIVAATDLDELRVNYRSDELKFVQACQEEKQKEGKSRCDQALIHLHRLVIHVFGIAQKLLKICEKLPDNHPLKAETQALIREKLGIAADTKGKKNFDAPIGTLISYHKVSHVELKQDGDVIDLYGAFFGNTLCQKAWGLTPHDFKACIDYRPHIDENDREALWRLFLTFYKLLSLIVKKAEKAFKLALHSRRDHPPHIALFLAFTLLFRRYHQADMNGLTAKHLNYFYQTVLRLQQRREVPDRVHIVFEIAQNVETYRLQKDTLLPGGKDTKGLDRRYALTEEWVINKAKLAEKQSLYFYNDGRKTTPIALPAADKRDGVKTPYSAGQKAWHPLSGLALYRKWQLQNEMLNAKSTRKETITKETAAFQQTTQKQLKAITAKPGLLISTPELWLAKGGNRTITISFQGKIPLNDFYTDISTTEGIHTFEDDFNTTKPTPSEDPVLLAAAVRKFVLASVFGYDNQNDTTLWAITLPADFKAIAPPKNEQERMGGEVPFIRIRLKETADYESVLEIKSSLITISTRTNGLKNLSLQLGSIQYPPTAEIPLIGSTVDQTAMLYVTAPELSVKNGKADLILPNIEGVMETNSSIEIKAIPDWVIPVETFENPVTYTVTTPYTFFKKVISIPKGNADAPINIFKIPGESISINYESTSVEPNLYWLDFLGGYSPVEREEDRFSIVPDHRLATFEKTIEAVESRVVKKRSGKDAPKTLMAAGNLRLAFEDLLPGQSLSLLFHFAEGTGNPDKIAPDEIVWSYLRQNQWVRIPPQFIVTDETLGLRQTGIIRFQIPFDINNGNTLAVGKEGRADLYWLQASASEDPEANISVNALPMLIDIFPQAATAVFQNNQNEVSHLEEGLPAKTISQLRYRDANVAKVEQPFASFDGRLSEEGNLSAYYRRIHERLRHKQRAITLWDYERLTLEQFPKVAIAKCLTHTRDTDVTRPGFVTLGVVPYPAQMVGNGKYYPIFNAGFLETVERYLNRYNSYFVSGTGGGVVCCCAKEDDGCGCSHEGHLLVRNAIFEPVRLQVCVKFKAGKDAFYYKKQLNEDLKNFLAPWAVDGQTPLLFGGEIYTVELLRFLENLEYVDVIMGLKIKHIPNRSAAEANESLFEFEEMESIKPFTSRSVLTTYLDVLNEDNSNVIDHDIQIIEDQSCCADCA